MLGNYREGSREVQGRREGSGKVQGRFREDSGKVEGRFRKGSGKVQSTISIVYQGTLQNLFESFD